MGNASSGDYSLLNRLADEFVARYRKGERPGLQEYLDRYPQLADDIREVFPALVEIEQVRGDRLPAGAPAPPAAPFMPAHVGDYRILREVGKGGMGVVYEAEQLSLGRHVALKLLPRDMLRDERHKRRFEREARAAARLHHTNIVPVFGVGEHDGQPYYVMQFIQGLGLDEVLDELRRLRAGGASGAATAEGGLKVSRREGPAAEVARSLLTGQYRPPTETMAASPAREEDDRSAAPAGRLSDSFSLSSSSSVSLPGADARKARREKPTYWESVARIGFQVADALEHAHKQGILHRDVKPSNLLLDTQGTVWVTDFGLAKVDDQQGLTHTGDILGTLRYMPPEAFEGRADARGDVYALGLTLYELLTFRPAFGERDRPKLIKQVTTAEVPRLRKVNRQVPRDLETIVHKAIDREPGRRYQTAGELAADLQRFIDDEPIRARRIGALEQLARWCRRNRAVASLLASVVLLLAVLAVGASVAAVSLRRKTVRAESAELEARKKAFEALVSQARAGRFSRRQGQRFETLQAVRDAMTILPTLDLPDDEQARHRDALRNLAISALILADVRLRLEVPRPLHGIRLNAAGDRYLGGEPQGDTVLYRADDHAELARLPGGGAPSPAEFSPLGPERVWVYRPNGDGYRLLEWDPTTGATRVLVEKTVGRDSASVNLDLNRWAIANSARGLVEVRELPSFRQVRLFSTGETGVGFALSPDGRKIAVVNGDYGRPARRIVRVFDLQTADPVAELAHQDSVCTMDWMPDGRTLAAGCWNTNEIQLWDVPSRKVARVLDGQKGGAPAIAVNRTGDLLASTSYWARGLRLWQPRTGRELLSVPDYKPGLRRDAAGDTLFGFDAYAAEIKELWEIVPGRECRTRAPTPGVSPRMGSGTLAVSPDGRLAATGVEGGVSLWDLARGEERGFLGIGAGNSWFEPGSGDLFTFSVAGLLRWPLTWSSPSELRVGPPLRVSSIGQSGRQIGGSFDGKTLAVTGYPGLHTLVFHLQGDRPPTRLGPYNEVRRVAVSPDGKYVATPNFYSPAVKVWDARTGACLADLPAAAMSVAGFSPDGRWLAVLSNSASEIWEVGTWRSAHKVPPPWWTGGISPLAFSPDSRLLALESGRGAVRLVDPSTGRDLALLEDPDQSRANSMNFSGDGSRLVTLDADGRTLRVWDLRAIRRQLDELGLDWGAPPLPAPAGATPAAIPTPLQIRVDLGPCEDDAELAGRPTVEHLYALIAESSCRLLLHPSDFKALRRRGRAYGCLAQLYGRDDAARSAVADYGDALDLLPADDPARVDLLSRRAGNHLMLGEDDLALDDVRRAGRIDPAGAPLIRRGHADGLVNRAAGAVRKKDPTAALRLLRLAVEIDADHAAAHNNLAWLLLTAPAESRNPEEALAHARKAVALAPEQQTYNNTLGVALYRNGQFAEAVPSLERSLKEGGGKWDAYDLFFLVMCHHRLGDEGKARECRDRAERWLREHKGGLPGDMVEELTAFQAEAAAVLAGPPGPRK